MNKKLVETAKLSLEKEKLKLQKKITTLNLMPRFGDSQEDNALEVTEASNNLSLKDDLRREIKAIELALRAIEKGKYGLCQKCGIPIEPARIKLVPTAIHCAGCQGKVKKKR